MVNKITIFFLILFLTCEVIAGSVVVIFYRIPNKKYRTKYDTVSVDKLRISEVYNNSTNKVGRKTEFAFKDKEIMFKTKDKVIIYGWYVGEVEDLNRLKHKIYEGRHDFGTRILNKTNVVYKD